MTATTQIPTTLSSHFGVAYAQGFKSERLLHLPKFLSNTEVRQWVGHLEQIPARRVRCGNTIDVTWLEQSITQKHPIGSYLSSESIVNMMQETGGFTDQKLTKFQCWSCYYSEGEYINEHVDTIGDIQLLICLIATPPDKGGLLHAVTSSKSTLPIHMTPGDALIFEATAIPHFTTPVLGEESERLVVAARYFFQA